MSVRALKTRVQQQQVEDDSTTASSVQDSTEVSAPSSDSDNSVNEAADSFVAIDPNEPGTVAELLAGLQQNPNRHLESLCTELGLSGDEREQFKQGFHQAIAGLDKSLTAEEQGALDVITNKINAAKQHTPVDTSRTAQFTNNLKAGTIAWAVGFGAAVALVKGLGASALGPAALHFINFAGPFMLLGSEVLAGKYRAQGANYAAVDLAAYTGYDTTVAERARLGLKMAGVSHAGRKRTDEYRGLQKQYQDLTIKKQAVCSGLIKRELGRTLGLKDNADVPSDVTLLSCIHSQLKGDAKGRVSLPDGTKLFKCEKGGAPGTFMVKWPTGEVTDLNKDPIPKSSRADFAKAEGLLLGAARARSMVCDEATIMTFAGVEALGSVGLWIQANFGKSQSTIAADAVIGVGMAFFGTQSYLHSQSAARAYLSGNAVQPGVSSVEQHARYDKAELNNKMVMARIRELDDMRGQLKEDRKQTERALTTARGADKPDKDLVKQLENRLDLIDQATREVKKATKALTKQGKGLETAQSQAAGKLPGTWVAAKAAWRDLATNAALISSKLICYTAAFLVYSEFYARFTSALVPPAANHTGNATMDHDLHNTTGTSSDPAAWNPYIVASAFNATVIAIPYMLKNNVGVRGLQYAFNRCMGGVEYLMERYKGGPAGDDIEVSTASSDEDEDEDFDYSNVQAQAHVSGDDGDDDDNRSSSSSSSSSSSYLGPDSGNLPAPQRRDSDSSEVIV